jgi:hypothetical protein
MALSHSAQSGRHAFAARGVDLYETPPEATRALLRVEQLPHRLWEPACGRGAIVRVLRKAGHDVHATDLYHHGCGISGVDFLAAAHRDLAVVTNPPYQLAHEFVARALEFSPLVIMLLRLGFLESEKRSDVLDGGKLARVHVFRNRLPMMHRDGWAGPLASSAIPFAWFVWDSKHIGPTTIDRISWVKGDGKDKAEGAMR